MPRRPARVSWSVVLCFLPWLCRDRGGLAGESGHGLCRRRVAEGLVATTGVEVADVVGDLRGRRVPGGEVDPAEAFVLQL